MTAHVNGPGRAVSPPPAHPIAVLDLPRLEMMFYNAGWWIAKADASRWVDAPGLDDDLASRAVAGIGGVFGYHPTIMVPAEGVDNPVKIDHGADVIATDLMKQFFTILNERGPMAAHVFALSIHARCLDAQKRIGEWNAEARNYDRAAANEAEKIAYFFHDVLFVSEILLAVGVCVLSAGMAPAFLAGGASAATQAGAATAISMTYGVVSNMVKAKPVKDNAISAIEGVAVSTALMKTGKATDHRLELVHKAIHRNTALARQSRSLITKLNGQLGDQIALRRAVTTAQKVRPTANLALASTKLSALKPVAAGLTKVSHALPFVGLGVDLFNAIHEFADQEHELKQGSN